MPQKCTKCDKQSIPGLIKGAGKCQFHWNEGLYGKEWAEKCEKDRLFADKQRAAVKGAGERHVA